MVKVCKSLTRNLTFALSAFKLFIETGTKSHLNLMHLTFTFLQLPLGNVAKLWPILKRLRVIKLKRMMVLTTNYIFEFK